MTSPTANLFIKHVLMVFIPSATLVVGVSYFFYQRDIANIHNNLATQAQMAIHSAAAAAEHSLTEISRDVRYLAHSRALMSVITENNPKALSDLSKDWYAFSQSKQIYDQVRWIDESGMERVRVNYHAEQPVIVASEALQDKSKRYFFLETMKLKADEIFISPFDLNIEDDQIEIPWKPTIRISTRVFDTRATARGIVILNYFGQDLLEQLRAVNDSGLWLTNAAGFWLLGPQTAVEWGFMRNRPELTVAQRYPEAWARIAKQESASFETVDGYWRFKTIRPLHLHQKTSSGSGTAFQPSPGFPAGDSYIWKLIHFQPRSIYADKINEINWRYGSFLFLMLGGLAIGASLLARSRHAETLALIEATNAYRSKQEAEHMHTVAMSEHAEQLQLAMAVAEQASQAKSDFVANMSHEIRTPINAILGLVYLLEQQELTPTMRCMVKQVGVAGKSLLGIINDILDFSKIEANRISLEQIPFRLSTVLDNLAGIMSTSLGEKPIEIVVGPLPPGCDELKGDPLRLAQVLVELANNAIKFTEQGEVVVTTSRLDNLETANHVRLRFSVRDTGIGIAKAKQQLIFEAFSQSDSSTTRRFGGSGLGLTICRHLVKLMGGDLQVNSQLGQGSEFYFELDFEVTAHSSMPEMLYQHILVADDNNIAREVLANTAAHLGWHVDTVDSGEKAVALFEKATQKPYDVLLLDWRMPGGDGIAAAATIREKYPEQTAPIIVMATAYDRELLREQPGSEVADILLNKPVTASSLYNAVAEAKSRRGQLKMVLPKPPDNLVLKGIRILVVDDSEINRDVAKQILVYNGAETEVAEDGAKALQILKAKPEGFDIVLMDVQMPVMDGYTATRKIKSTPGLAHLPVVALTAGAYKVHQLAAFDSGMDEYIAKPFDVDELLGVICRLAQKNTGSSSALASTSLSPSVLNDSTPASSNENVQLIDIGQGLHHWGELRVYHKYLGLFLRDHRDDGKRIVDALQQGNHGQAIELAHKLCGAAGSLSLLRTNQLAGDLEQALTKNRAVNELAEMLVDSLSQTSNVIQEMIALSEEGDDPVDANNKQD